MIGITGVKAGVVIMTNSDAGDTLATEIAKSVAGVYEWPVVD
jgi:hypothetical protein